jgi:CDP-glycerol glycerophosphotransferase (TagB/SpsB family)
MKKFLIYISQPYSIPIGRPLQSEIEKRGFLIRWFCDEEETRKSLSNRETLLNSIEEVLNYHPDVVLVATNVVPHFFSGIKVQIFHGFSVGKRNEAKGHFNIRGLFDLYCTQGESTTKPFLELQKKHQYFEVVETGWSKVDPLFPLKAETSLPKNKKPTIIISSTFTTRLSLAKNPEVLEEIERLSKLDKYQFLSVLHPKMEQEIVEKFKNFNNKNFTFYDTTELIPLFKKADVMLSDTTSAITEFVLQKKPVVTINNNQPKSYMINIHHANEIEKALELALSKPKEIMEELEKFINITHPYNDGKSSVRVVDACLDFLAKNRIKRKPLNLVRKFKIRKKLGYFKI